MRLTTGDSTDTATAKELAPSGQAKPPVETRPYQLFIDDNFHYMDEDERVGPIEFATAADARAEARKIVDSFLESNFKQGMEAAELYSTYVCFGEDPFIRCPGDEEIKFSAFDYARVRSEEICTPNQKSGEQNGSCPQDDAPNAF